MLKWPGDNKIVLKPRTAAPLAGPGSGQVAPDPNLADASGTPPLSALDRNPSSVQCPFCRYQQPVGPAALSIFCKNCNKRINLEGPSSFRPAIPARAALRSIACPSCQATQEVPSNALSAFCPKCGKRINMQDYQIRGKFNGDIQTKGTLTVALGGDVRADVQVGNAIIEGKLYGTIRADGKVELRSTGQLRGDIFAKTIVVHEGATFLGNCSAGRT